MFIYTYLGRLCILWLFGKMFFRCLLGLGLVLFTPFMFLVIFCLVLSITPLLKVGFEVSVTVSLFLYFYELLLYEFGSLVCCMYICNCYTFLLDWHFVIIQFPCLSLVTFLPLSIFCDINIEKLPLFVTVFVLFPTFCFQLLFLNLI